MKGMLQTLASRDTWWSAPPQTPSGLPPTSSKRIIFIRHGESAWNEVFNRGFNVGFLFRYARAVFLETLVYATPYSYFCDTPLNAEGIDQARGLAAFLASESHDVAPVAAAAIACLRGDVGAVEKSIIVSSNLRRALSTVAIGLWRRLDRTGERIVINSMCQEISRNVDCMASAESGTIPHMEGPDCGDAARRMAHPARDGGAYVPEAIFDPAMNGGQKPLSERGVERLQAFAEWVFARPESTIIVGGHSLWFKAFFKVFLAAGQTHVGTARKVVNGGVVTFTLNMHHASANGSSDSGAAAGANSAGVDATTLCLDVAKSGRACQWTVGAAPPTYWIDAESIVTVVGGFEGAVAVE